jgi:hypothetical protein
MQIITSDGTLFNTNNANASINQFFSKPVINLSNPERYSPGSLYTISFTDVDAKKPDAVYYLAINISLPKNMLSSGNAIVEYVSPDMASDRYTFIIYIQGDRIDKIRGYPSGQSFDPQKFAAQNNLHIIASITLDFKMKSNRMNYPQDIYSRFNNTNYENDYTNNSNDCYTYNGENDYINNNYSNDRYSDDDYSDHSHSNDSYSNYGYSDDNIYDDIYDNE